MYGGDRTTEWGKHACVEKWAYTEALEKNMRIDPMRRSGLFITV
jgi:hypothetical protein